MGGDRETPEGRAKREGVGKRVMRPLFENAGPLYFYTFIAVVVVMGALSSYLGADLATTALPLPFYAVGLVGLHLLIAAFFMGARDPTGDRPSFGTVSYLWLFVGMYLIVATAIYLRLELAYPEAPLPGLPGWLVLGLRVAPFVLLFQVGWGTLFGMIYGLLGAETNAHPLRWLFRRTSPGLDGNPDEVEGDE